VKLITGLGNPGREYSASRHNIGFRCINYFAKDCDIRLDHRKAKARVGQGVVAGIPVVLARPGTFMNHSGDSVAPLLRQLDLSPQDLIVVYDDLDLPLGRIRIRPSGSAGGHRGMKSIIRALDSRDFTRIRVGIGRPDAGTPSSTTLEVVEYVLGRFSSEEDNVAKQAVTQASAALYDILSEGLDKAMNRFNSPQHGDEIP